MANHDQGLPSSESVIFSTTEVHTPLISFSAVPQKKVGKLRTPTAEISDPQIIR